MGNHHIDCLEGLPLHREPIRGEVSSKGCLSESVCWVSTALCVYV